MGRPGGLERFPKPLVGSSSLPRPTSPSFWLQSRSTQKVFCKWKKYLRSSSRFALDDPAIRNLQIPYPPDEEDQKKIADDMMQRLAESADLRKQAGAISDVLPKKLGE